MSSELDAHQIRRHFSAHAIHYDHYARVQKRVAEKLATELIPASEDFAGRRLLDVGAGTGMLSAHLQRRYSQAHLVLSDLAEGMCLQLRQRFEGADVCGADASRLPFAACSFQGVLSASVYQWVNDLPGAFAEAGRVLRPGGLFALALYGADTLRELRQSHRRALGEAETKSHAQRFPDDVQVKQSLVSAGFSVLELLRESQIEYHGDVESLLRSLKMIGAQNARSDRPPGLASRKIMMRMREHYQETFGGPEGIPATYDVIYAVARKR